MGFTGYPTLRLMTLVETGIRGLIGAVIGSAAYRDEIALPRVPASPPARRPGCTLGTRSCGLRSSARIARSCITRR